MVCSLIVLGVACVVGALTLYGSITSFRALFTGCKPKWFGENQGLLSTLCTNTFLVIGSVMAAWWAIDSLWPVETSERVIERYREAFEGKREQLAALVKKLPDPGHKEAPPRWALLEPKPGYQDGDYSYSVLLEHHLTGWNRPADQSGIPDYLLRDGFLSHLYGTAKTEEARRGWRLELDQDGRRLDRALRASLKRPYLLVIRTLKYEPTRINSVKDSGRYQQHGLLHLQAFLIDLRSNEILGSVKAEESYGFEIGRFSDLTDPKLKLDSANVRLASAACQRLATALNEATGGSFDFGRYP